MASLLSFAGNAVKSIGNTVKNDVVNPIEHVAQAAPSAIANVVSRVPVVGSPLANVDRGIASQVSAVPRAAFDTGASVQGLLTHNPTAELNAANAAARAQKTVVQSAQQFTDPVAEAGLSVMHPTQFQATAQGRLGRDIFGNNPVQNVQKNVMNNYLVHKSVPLAVADAIGQAVKIGSTVAPEAKGAAELAGKAGDLADARVPLNDIGAVGKDVNKVPTPPKTTSGIATVLKGNKNLPTIPVKNIDQSEIALHGNALGAVGQSHFAGIAKDAIPLANKADLNKVGILAQASKLQSVRADANQIMYGLSDRVGGALKDPQAIAARRLDYFNNLYGSLRSAGTPEGAHLQAEIDKITGHTTHSPALPEKSPAKISTPVVGENKNIAVGQGSEQIGNKATRFTKTTIPNSPEVSAAVKKDVGATYKPGTNAEKLATSSKLASGDLDKATNQVKTNLNVKLGSASPQDISDAIKLAKVHDAAGNTETATELYNKVGEHLTAAGQTVQAGSLLASRSPEGLMNDALNTIKKGGGNLTDNLKSQVQDAYAKIKAAPEGTNERAFAIQDLQKIVNDNVNHSKLDQGFLLWRTGLLTGPLTGTKVIASHALLNIAEKAKDIPAVALDKAMRPFTGVRSTALTLRGAGSGAAEGGKAGLTLLRSGHDTPGTSALGGTFDELGTPKTSFGTSKLGKAANFYTSKVGQFHAAAPKSFYRSAYENDLYKQADAAFTNVGKNAGDRATFVKNFVTKPSDEADSAAHLQAARAAFQQPTFLGKQVTTLMKAPGVREAIPFGKIAATILTDAKDYSPIGAMQSVYKAAIDSKTGWTPAIQKDLVEGIGRGVTGTGVVALGAALAKKGDITTGYPTDKKEQTLWQAEGKQANSIKVGNQWRQTPALGPFASLLQAGAYLQQSKGKSPTGKANATAALTGALSNLSGQSYLSGLTSIASAVQNPTENLGSTAKLEAGSVIPVGVGQIAAATDSKTRTTQNAGQSIESKIPGLREKLPVAQTVFGQPISNPDRGATGLLDPTRPTNATNDPVVNELQRLVNTSGTTPVPVPSAPTKISGTGSNGLSKSIPLSKVQQAQFTSAAGPQIKNALAAVISQPGYSSLDDNSKAAALTNAKTLAENAVKTQAFNQLSSNTKDPVTGVNTSINTGTVAAAAVQKAKVAADKAAFTTSGSNFQTIDGTVFSKDAAGNVTSTPATTYQYDLGTATLTQQKDAGDLSGWLNTAQNQLSLITKQLADPTINTNPLQVTKLQNDASTLQTDIAKYTTGGSFSSSDSYGSSSSSISKVQNYKTTGGANIKAPKFKAISVKGSKAAYKAPRVSKPKASTAKVSIKSSKAPKAPQLGVVKASKQPKKSPFGEA